MIKSFYIVPGPESQSFSEIIENAKKKAKGILEKRNDGVMSAFSTEVWLVCGNEEEHNVLTHYLSNNCHFVSRNVDEPEFMDDLNSVIQTTIKDSTETTVTNFFDAGFNSPEPEEIWLSFDCSCVFNKKGGGTTWQDGTHYKIRFNSVKDLEAAVAELKGA